LRLRRLRIESRLNETGSSSVVGRNSRAAAKGDKRERARGSGGERRAQAEHYRRSTTGGAHAAAPRRLPAAPPACISPACPGPPFWRSCSPGAPCRRGCPPLGQGGAGGGDG
jgi:hypothetical protein